MSSKKWKLISLLCLTTTKLRCLFIFAMSEHFLLFLAVLFRFDPFYNCAMKDFNKACGFFFRACLPETGLISFTAQKMKFSMKDFFSKCDQIRRNLRIWWHLLKKFLMVNFIFCAVFNLNKRLFK